MTSIDDSDTLSLSCQNDGEIARYDLVDEWYCSTDIDTDTVLDRGCPCTCQWEALSLASGTQVNGSDVVTVDTLPATCPQPCRWRCRYATGPSGCIGIRRWPNHQSGNGSQVDGSNIVTAGDFDTYLPTDLADGDADTLASLSCAQGELAVGMETLHGSVYGQHPDESTVEGYITNEAIDLMRAHKSMEEILSPTKRMLRRAGIDI